MFAGEYPAGGSVRITVHTDKKAAFPIHLRIPEWANGATVAADGDILPAQAGGFVTLNRDWQDGDELLLTLPMAVRKLPAFHQAVSVARGPIRFVYAPKTVAHDDVLSAGMDFAVALVGAEEIRVIERMDGSVALCRPRDAAAALGHARRKLRPAADRPRATRTSRWPSTRSSCRMPRRRSVWPFCPCFKQAIKLDLNRLKTSIFRIWGFAPSPHQRAFRAFTAPVWRIALWKPSGANTSFYS